MKDNNAVNSRMQLLVRHGRDILSSDGMQREKGFVQHGKMSTYDHSVSVALMSIRLVELLRIKRVDIRSMIRGALLHDYYLYDWHIPDAAHKGHALEHARRAFENARRDFKISATEQDVILKHMFPLNPRLPKCREAVIVTAADKICALKETIKRF